jgi:hypothetical protein
MNRALARIEPTPTAGRPDRVIEVGAALRDGTITTEMSLDEMAGRVMDRSQILILKRVFDDETLAGVRAAVRGWARQIAAAETDDFGDNYHRRRAMVSRLQQAPHVFHDFNFNDLGAMPAEARTPLCGLFVPLRGLYNGLTGHQTTFEIPQAGPYVHPQIIHYPSGGGFFARHWHNLQPQKLGFIVSLSKPGRDYRNGGVCFEIDGEVVDLEGRHDIGDICVWRYDHHHWVTQSDLQDKFDWDNESGRWVATFAYFDPYA